MYGLPDSWTGHLVQKAVTYKPRSRKRSMVDIENLEGWLEWFMPAPKAITHPIEEEEPAQFTDREEKQNRVRFRVVDD